MAASARDGRDSDVYPDVGQQVADTIDHFMFRENIAALPVSDTPMINPAMGPLMTGSVVVADNPFDTDLSSLVTTNGSMIRIVWNYRSTVITVAGRIRSRPAWEAGMTLARLTRCRGSIDYLHAGRSRFALVPFSTSLLAAPISWLTLSLALFVGWHAAIAALNLPTACLVPYGLDQGRS